MSLENEVTILVLVEYSLQHKQISKTNSLKKVTILVLVEYSLQQNTIIIF